MGRTSNVKALFPKRVVRGWGRGSFEPKPHDPLRPVVCLDETSKQMIVGTREPIPAAPGRKARHDYEYARNGVENLFMMFAPQEGSRPVKVTDRHPAINYAQALKDLSDTHLPGAAKIVLVQDNLSTHKPASPETSDVGEALRARQNRQKRQQKHLLERINHFSWLPVLTVGL